MNNGQSDIDEAQEQWKPIASADKVYMVSDYGRVKSFATSDQGELVTGKTYLDGSFVVDFRVDGKKRSHYVHRLVAEAFLPRETPQHKLVLHKNGEKDDNRAENLMWVTTKQVSKAKAERKIRKPTTMPDDGKEYFMYGGFYHRVHDNGTSKFIRLTVDKNVTRSVSLGEIILDRAGHDRPGKNYVVHYNDGDYRNLSIDNLSWLSKSDKTKIFLSNNIEAYVRVKEMGENNKKNVGLPDKMKDLIRGYREKGRSYSKISKLLNLPYSTIYKFCKQEEI